MKKCEKGHKLKLMLGPPDGNHDLGWGCGKCSGYYAFSEEEQSIWENGFLWGKDSLSGAVRQAKQLELLRAIIKDMVFDETYDEDCCD